MGEETGGAKSGIHHQQDRCEARQEQQHQGLLSNTVYSDEGLITGAHSLDLCYRNRLM